MNELFRVDSLDEITYDHFEMACVAARDLRFIGELS